LFKRGKNRLEQDYRRDFVITIVLVVVVLGCGWDLHETVNGAVAGGSLETIRKTAENDDEDEDDKITLKVKASGWHSYPGWHLASGSHLRPG
jgi:hypothetical protein